MRRITPFLTFNGNAEEAVSFYVSIFKNSSVIHTTRYGENAPHPKGTVMTIRFLLNGEEHIALNGLADWKFTEAVSFVVGCETQDEIDYFWEKLSASGGQPIQCGWLKDRFGVFWQVVPTALWPMMEDRDETRVNRVMQALWGMEKLDLAALQRAAGQG